MPNVTLIDNYDSFTWNLVHYLGSLGAVVSVRRNNRVTVAEVIAELPDAIVLSPGPCTPNDAGICLDLIRQASARIPVFGVCLGHQAIGQVFGGEVVRAPVPVHGKLSQIKHQGGGVFVGINGPFQATCSGFSAGAMSRLITTASLSLRTSTHSSSSLGLALISWCGT